MKVRQIGKGDGSSYVAIFRTGEEAMQGLASLAKDEGLQAAHFHGIGALQAATFAFFDWDIKGYRDITVDEQFEILSLVGNMSLRPDGEPMIHAHITLGRPDGTMVGGHLKEAHIRPTLEVFIEATPQTLRRAHDDESGLDLIDPDL